MKPFPSHIKTRVDRDYPLWYRIRIQGLVQRYQDNPARNKHLVLVLIERVLENGPVMGL